MKRSMSMTPALLVSYGSGGLKPLAPNDDDGIDEEVLQKKAIKVQTLRRPNRQCRLPETSSVVETGPETMTEQIEQRPRLDLQEQRDPVDKKSRMFAAEFCHTFLALSELPRRGLVAKVAKVFFVTC
jgi:hypothetical protein